MCLSVPMKVLALEAGGDLAVVGRGERRERVNMLLVGPQPVGTWVLVALGFAKEVVPQDELVLIEEALAALACAVMHVLFEEGFADLDRARFTTPAPVAGGGR